MSLQDYNLVVLPSLHIKLQLNIHFVEPLEEDNSFKYLNEKFPKLYDLKIRKRVSVGEQVKKLAPCFKVCANIFWGIICWKGFGCTSYRPLMLIELADPLLSFFYQTTGSLSSIGCKTKERNLVLTIPNIDHSSQNFMSSIYLFRIFLSGIFVATEGKIRRY